MRGKKFLSAVGVFASYENTEYFFKNIGYCFMSSRPEKKHTQYNPLKSMVIGCLLLQKAADKLTGVSGKYDRHDHFEDRKKPYSYRLTILIHAKKAGIGMLRPSGSRYN